jgi:hypothetical protein
VKASDLYWLAGLLEGEGCFCSPGIKLGVTDRDVVVRVARILERHVRGPYKYGYKPVYYTEIWAGPAIDWMRKLLPLMGRRRAAKIRSIVARWKKAPGKGHKKGTGARPRCHPNRRHYAFFMCRSCYRKNKWARGLPR